MTETTQLSGKIRHKCSKTMLLTPQELFELDRYIESLRASDSFTEDEKRAVTENDFSRWETLSCGLRTWIAEKHYAEFLAAPTVPVDEAYLESSVFELSLEKWALDPAFRLALSARILADRRRSPNTVGVYERCEQKMNAYLMERALTPGAANDTQLALAEALFLAQLGGVEVVQTAKGQTGSYFLGAEATVTEPFAHGGRVAFLLPADTDFRALRPCPAVQHFALRKADGTVLRRRARESEHPARQYSADLADQHIYLRPYKGGEGRYAALTLGIQSDAPGGVSPLGHAHSDWAHSERQSGFLACRRRPALRRPHHRPHAALLRAADRAHAGICARIPRPSGAAGGAGCPAPRGQPAHRRTAHARGNARALVASRCRRRGSARRSL